ncbi:MAG: MFS transporter [Rhodobacteraceae bacterium]|nr:MFS transporter [Paracoccaceae bacterium]
MNLAALSYRDFRIYVSGNLFALNGMLMQRLTIGWLAWDLTQSASFVGLVAFVNFVPTVLTGPVFGVLIDRADVKRAALATQTSLLVLAMLLFASFRLDMLGPVLLTVFSLLLGVVASAHNPVRMSLAPRLVARAAVPSVVTLVAINFNLARLTGPALAGWIIAGWGIGVAMVVPALCYLPFIMALSRLNPRERSRPVAKATFLGALTEGVRHAAGHRHIRDAIIATGIFAFVIRGTLEILPVLADGVFAKGAAGLGLLTSAAGLGAVMAGLFKALTPGQSTSRLPRGALLLTLIGIGAVGLLGMSQSWELSLALVVWLGFASSVSGISMQTAIQIDLDDDLRGRVMSLWAMVGIGAAAVGAMVLGLLVDLVGFAPTLGLAGAAGVVLLGALIARLR